MNTSVNRKFNHINIATFKPDVHEKITVVYYCNSAVTKHAVAMLGQFLGGMGHLVEYRRAMNDPSWCGIVSLELVDTRDGETRTVSITTETQLKEIQKNPLLSLRGGQEKHPAIGTLSALVPPNNENVVAYLYETHSSILVFPKAVNILDAVGRALYDFDDSVLTNSEKQK